jgi:NADPH:quinone reductase-like Zn-dependent oxidoreductase
MRVNKVEAHASVARATGGRGAQVVFDNVGGPMFEPSLEALGHRGRQVEIASVARKLDRRCSTRTCGAASTAPQTWCNGSKTVSRSDEGVSGDVR